MRRFASFLINLVVFEAVFFFFVFMYPYFYALISNQKSLDFDSSIFGLTFFKAFIGDGRIYSEVSIAGVIFIAVFSGLFTLVTDNLMMKIRREFRNGQTESKRL